MLRAAGVATAALDSDVLLTHVLGISKETLYAHPDTEMTHGAMRRFRELIERRAAGEPVAYLRGFKEFYGLRFAVDPRVLIPRPETETLVDAARDFIRGRALSVADIGTGSGAIAVARVNAQDNGVADRVEFRQGDLLAPLGERLDVVVANLPYLRDVSFEHLFGDRTSLAFEPRVALTAGKDGLELIWRAAAGLGRVLAPGGAALFEIDPPLADQVVDLLRHSVGGGPHVVHDLAGDARVVIVQEA